MSPRLFKLGKKKLAEMTVHAKENVRSLVQPRNEPNDHSTAATSSKIDPEGIAHDADKSSYINEGVEASKQTMSVNEGSATADPSGPSHCEVSESRVPGDGMKETGLVDDHTRECDDVLDHEDAESTPICKKASEVAMFQNYLLSKF